MFFTYNKKPLISVIADFSHKKTTPIEWFFYHGLITLDCLVDEVQLYTP